MAYILEKPTLVFSGAVALRVGMLFYGSWQDKNSALKYTDIDYYVFTDAARFTARGASPYSRDTYRYTPLLAWMLLPTTWSPVWFSFGKILFAVGDILTGWLIISILCRTQRFSVGRATKYATIWLLNPMVATISTRGSSEGLLAFVVMLTLWASVKGNHTLSGVFLGLAVHLKIYPFIYAVSLAWSMNHGSSKLERLEWPKSMKDGVNSIVALLTPQRIRLLISSAVTFLGLNLVMYLRLVTIDLGVDFILTWDRYGYDFLEHTFFYHLVRSDHRHNFSPYNTMLYARSASLSASSFRPESLAFLPQIMLSGFIVPIVLAKQDIASTQLVQTLAFVAFNKVCTSQVCEPHQPSSLYIDWEQVLPLVYGLSTFLPSRLRNVQEVDRWRDCDGTLDSRTSIHVLHFKQRQAILTITGYLATARLST